MALHRFLRMSEQRSEALQNSGLVRGPYLKASNFLLVANFFSSIFVCARFVYAEVGFFWAVAGVFLPWSWPGRGCQGAHKVMRDNKIRRSRNAQKVSFWYGNLYRAITVQGKASLVQSPGSTESAHLSFEPFPVERPMSACIG